MVSPDLIKVEIFTNSLYTGMILQGNAFNEKGILVLNKGIAIKQEDIDKLKTDGVKKIYYTRDRLSYRKNAKAGMINDVRVEKAINVLSDVEGRIKNKASFYQKDVLEGLVKDFMGDIENNFDTFLNLFDLSGFSEYQYGHAVNVATIAIITGLSLKMDNEKVCMLGLAGLLMNLGMLLVPPGILEKPGPLNDEEWEIIKQHPVYSYNLLGNEKDISPEVLKGVLLHHEWYNGGGYPLKVNYEKMNDIAQIVSLADVFDAATTKKPYKEAISYNEVYSYILKNMGERFNPDIAKVFLTHVTKKLNDEPIFPEGTYVLLNTGEIGYVIGYRYDKHTLRPMISIFMNLRKEPNLLKFELQVDLENDQSRQIVVSILDPTYVEKLHKARLKEEEQGVIIFDENAIKQ
jgi:HD-GYP domain-containing protein (c-di-GMP phosphodiesterase class II)